MNSTLKRAAVACLAMFALLMINVNYIQGVKASDYRDDSRNQRNFFERYAVQRGRITAGGTTIIAQSKETKGDFKYLRDYPDGPLYAHVTGFFSPRASRRSNARRTACSTAPAPTCCCGAASTCSPVSPPGAPTSI